MELIINEYIEKIKSLATNGWLKMGLILILGMVMGSFLFSTEGQPEMVGDNHSDHVGETTWTCSMHPQIKLAEAGQCPICFMDLIPLANDENSESPDHISLSESAVKLAQIATTPVRWGLAQSQVRLSGKIDYDETRVKNISAWFPGRLEHLYVDYTGIRIKQGDHLLEIFHQLAMV